MWLRPASCSSHMCLKVRARVGWSSTWTPCHPDVALLQLSRAAAGVACELLDGFGSDVADPQVPLHLKTVNPTSTSMRRRCPAGDFGTDSVMIPVMKPWLGDEEARAAADTVASGWVAQAP